MKKILMLIFTLCISLSNIGCPVKDVDDKSLVEKEFESIQIDQDENYIDETEQNTTEEPKDAIIEDDINVKADAEQIKVHFIDVGQADSVFIELVNGQSMLIDAGRQDNAVDVIDYIDGLNYNRIDYVVATHPHSDHIGGMANVLSSFEVGKMYMPKQAHTTRTFSNMLDVIEDKNISVYTAKNGVNIMSDGILKIDILAPFAESYSNLNNCSAVVKITYGQTVMLFTGDAEKEIEKQLNQSEIDADLLKVGHHGSETSSDKSFVESVSPDVAVISVGEGNSYGHPHSDTLAILNQVGANIYRTDEQGTIVVIADSNKRLTVNKKASSIKENAPPESEKKESFEGEKEPSSDDSQNQTVYRTKTGKKYHRDGCSYLKSKITTTLSEAKGMGLTPCSKCSPPN